MHIHTHTHTHTPAPAELLLPQISIESSATPSAVSPPEFVLSLAELAIYMRYQPPHYFIGFPYQLADYLTGNQYTQSNKQCTSSKKHRTLAAVVFASEQTSASLW